MKTEETKKIEEWLYKSCLVDKIHTDGAKAYCSSEVSMQMQIGFDTEFDEKYELVDFIKLDREHNITCYEIKVSLEDFKSKCRLSFYGDYNYLVMPKGLNLKIVEYLRKNGKSMRDYIRDDVGIMEIDLETNEKKVWRKSQKRDMGELTRRIILENMVKKFWYNAQNGVKY